MGGVARLDIHVADAVDEFGGRRWSHTARRNAGGPSQCAAARCAIWQLALESLLPRGAESKPRGTAARPSELFNVRGGLRLSGHLCNCCLHLAVFRRAFLSGCACSALPSFLPPAPTLFRRAFVRSYCSPAPSVVTWRCALVHWGQCVPVQGKLLCLATLGPASHPTRPSMVMIPTLTGVSLVLPTYGDKSSSIQVSALSDLSLLVFLDGMLTNNAFVARPFLLRSVCALCGQPSRP